MVCDKDVREYVKDSVRQSCVWKLVLTNFKVCVKDRLWQMVCDKDVRQRIVDKYCMTDGVWAKSVWKMVCDWQACDKDVYEMVCETKVDVTYVRLCHACHVKRK